MKRAIFAAIAVTAIAAALPATASADTTTTVPTVPSQCKQYYNPAGPSRIAHSTDRVAGAPFTGPNCDDVAGLCVTVDYPDEGASRAVHGRPTKVQPVPTPCVPLDESCAITVQPYKGPSRVTHQPAGVVRPRTQPSLIVEIPSACQEAMVLALTPTGSDTAPTIWIATAFLGAGTVLIIAPRRLPRR